MEKDFSYTKRPSVTELEQRLFEKVSVLDHGFIRLIDYMGDDTAIVQAARVSYGKGTKKTTQDAALINYLMRHKHTTPFEMCEIKLHLKMPIFVARQWLRHRTASINEYSARYSILSKEFYLPNIDVLAPQSSLNKQGREESSLSSEEAQDILSVLKNDAEQCYSHYQEMLNRNELGELINEQKQGLSRELARINLNLSHYTEFYWKINLHNLFHFLRLRADSHAQHEIRVYAEQILNLVKLWVPLSYEAFEEHSLFAVSLSAKSWKVVKSMLNGEKPSFEESGLGKREWDELNNLLEK